MLDADKQQTNFSLIYLFLLFFFNSKLQKQHIS